MDANSYSFKKDKIALTLSTVMTELFGDQCTEFLHVIATIGVTPDSELCGGTLFNFDQTISKSSTNNVQIPVLNALNTGPALSTITDSCHLPIEPAQNCQDTPHQNAGNQYSGSTFQLETCIDTIHEPKQELVLGSIAVAQDNGSNNTMAPYIIVPETSVDNNKTLNSSNVDSDRDTSAPELDNPLAGSPERTSSPSIPILERQTIIKRDSDKADTTNENEISLFVMSPDSSEDSVVVFETSQKCLSPTTPSSVNSRNTCTSANITIGGDHLVEFLTMTDSSSNVGDTHSLVWCTKKTVTRGVKKWKHTKFSQLLKNAPILNLECCSPIQPSSSSFFLALAQQLANLPGHPQQGISHSQLRAQVVDYMENIDESRVEVLCQYYIQGERSAWNKYKQIIGTESSLVDHLAVFLAGEYLDICIRLISMVTTKMRLVLKETVLNSNLKRHTVILGEYFPHYYQSLQLKGSKQSEQVIQRNKQQRTTLHKHQQIMCDKSPRVILKRLTTNQLLQKHQKRGMDRLRPRGIFKTKHVFSKRKHWGFPGSTIPAAKLRKRRAACGKCNRCKIKVDCGKCTNCRNKARSKNKCKLRKCIKLMKR